MAYSTSIKRQVRNAYVFENVEAVVLANQWDIPEKTILSWRARAKDTKDDWDTARQAYQSVNISEGLDKTTTMQTMSLFLKQYNDSLQALANEDTIPALDRVKAMASLADAFGKSTAAFKRVLPEQDKLSTSLETIDAFSKYLSKNHPDLLVHFASVLVDFGTFLRKNNQ